MIAPAAKRMALRHYRALDSANFRGWEDRLRELTARVPTLVARGEKDPHVAASWAEAVGAQQGSVRARVLGRAVRRPGGLSLRGVQPLASARGPRRAIRAAARLPGRGTS